MNIGFPPVKKIARKACESLPQTQPRLTIVVNHGHGMQAEELKTWIDANVSGEFCDVRCIYMQASSVYDAETSEFLPSWLTYEKEYYGKREDKISETALDDMTMALWKEIDELGIDTPIVLLGLSQGGCMALNMACARPVAAVITIVSHLLSVDKNRELLCPWYTLTAGDDAIYSKPWATRYNSRARHWIELKGCNHYLMDAKGADVNFVRNAISDVLSNLDGEEIP